MLEGISEWNLSLGALHWILAFEKWWNDNAFSTKYKGINSLCPGTLCYRVSLYMSKDIMSGVVQTVPILNVLQKLWPTVTDCDN